MQSNRKEYFFDEKPVEIVNPDQYNHRARRLIEAGLKVLRQFDLDSQRNLDFFCDYVKRFTVKNSQNFLLSLEFLHLANLANDTYYQVLMNANHIDIIYDVLQRLNHMKLIHPDNPRSQYNFELLVENVQNRPEVILESLKNLSDSPHLITQNNYELIAKREFWGLNWSLGFLRKADPRLDNQKNFLLLLKLINNETTSTNCHEVLTKLFCNDLLTQTNFNTMIRFSDYLEQINKKLQEEEPLTQITFDGIVNEIKEEMVKKRVALLMGSQPKLASPATSLFFKSQLCDRRNLIESIFDYLTPRIK